MSQTVRQLGISCLAGAAFGVGLALAGMTEPRKVIGFLDWGGEWDPSLLFVMGGAVSVHFVAYRLIRRRTTPLFAEAFVVPSERRIEPRLLIGAAIFGVGWGLAGYCPGPSIASLGSGSVQALVFVAAMLLGFVIARPFERSVSPASSGPAAGSFAPASDR